MNRIVSKLDFWDTIKERNSHSIPTGIIGGNSTCINQCMKEVQKKINFYNGGMVSIFLHNSWIILEGSSWKSRSEDIDQKNWKFFVGIANPTSTSLPSVTFPDFPKRLSCFIELHRFILQKPLICDLAMADTWEDDFVLIDETQRASSASPVESPKKSEKKDCMLLISLTWIDFLFESSVNPKKLRQTFNFRAPNLPFYLALQHLS